MRRTQLALLALTFLVGVAAVATAYLTLAGPLRGAIGILIMFVAPGFALARVARPARPLHDWECALASVGISLAVSTCSAVLLAALPIGLTRSSFAILLGGVTIVSTAIAATRSTLEARPAGSSSRVVRGFAMPSMRFRREPSEPWS